MLGEFFVLETGQNQFSSKTGITHPDNGYPAAPEESLEGMVAGFVCHVPKS